MDAMQSARREMAIIFAELWIWKDLSSRGPRNEELVNEVGDLVWVFRKTGKRYVEPYPVIRVDGTHVLIMDSHREVKFNKHQVLPATACDNITSGEHFVTILRSSLPKLSSNLPWQSSTVNCKAIPSVLIIEVLHYNGSPMRSEQADRADKQEIETSVRGCTW